MKISPFLLPGLVFVLLSFSCCKKDNPFFDLDSNVPIFYLDTFEQNLQQIFTTAPIGWAYVISENGQLARSGASGFARIDDDGEIPFSIDKKINTASLTKTLTAIGVMQLLERRGLSVDDKIAGFLPAGWQQDDGVDQLSFRDMLGHRSGLGSYNSNFDVSLCYDCIKAEIDTGVVVPSKPYNYQNINFALFRILIPSMWKGLPGAPNITLDDAGTQSAYLEYMQEHIFSPIGIRNANCTPEDPSTATLYYNLDDDISDFNGLYYDDWTHICGGGGYFLTTLEIAQVLAFLEHSETILSEDMRQVMKDGRLGYNRQWSTYEIRGDYYAKGGSIINGGQGVKGEMAIFPNDIEVVVMTNSQGQSYANSDGMLASIFDAYNAAWIKNN